MRSPYEDYPFVVRPADGMDEAQPAALRVLRGGSWNNPVHGSRCAVRSSYIPTHMYDINGMRLVCAPLLS